MSKSMSAGGNDASNTQPAELDRAYSKATWRLIPFIFVCYLFNYLDRVNVGQIAGFVSPFLVGWIKDLTHSTDLALYILSTVLFVGAVLVMLVPTRLVNR